MKPYEKPGVFPDCGCCYTTDDDGIHFCDLHEAAPDLLAALQAFVDYYDQAGMPDDLTPEYEEESDDGFDGDEVFNVRIGRAAIAKATTTTKPKE